MSKFRRRKVSVTLDTGERTETEALCLEYFAVHPYVHVGRRTTRTDGWTVTHLPSGLTVCFARTQRAAKRAASQLDDPEWNFSSKAQMNSDKEFKSRMFDRVLRVCDLPGVSRSALRKREYREREVPETREEKIARIELQRETVLAEYNSKLPVYRPE